MKSYAKTMRRIAITIHFTTIYILIPMSGCVGRAPVHCFAWAAIMLLRQTCEYVYTVAWHGSEVTLGMMSKHGGSSYSCTWTQYDVRIDCIPEGHKNIYQGPVWTGL